MKINAKILGICLASAFTLLALTVPWPPFDQRTVPDLLAKVEERLDQDDLQGAVRFLHLAKSRSSDQLNYQAIITRWKRDLEVISSPKLRQELLEKVSPQDLRRSLEKNILPGYGRITSTALVRFLNRRLIAEVARRKRLEYELNRLQAAEKTRSKALRSVESAKKARPKPSH